MSRRLADLAWPAIARAAAGDAVLVVPLGSCEQHGPHLPVTTDADIATALADGLAARRADVLVAPSVTYGSSGEHDGFAGTLSIGQAATELLLVELGRSAMGPFRRLLVLNCHGGNVPPLDRAVGRLRREGRDVRAWSPRWGPGADAHAGRTETSLQAHLRPAALDVGRAEPGDIRPLAEILPLLRAGGTRAVSANGVLGDPAGSSAAEGAALMDRGLEDLVAFVAGWAEEEHGT